MNPIKMFKQNSSMSNFKFQVYDPLEIQSTFFISLSAPDTCYKLDLDWF